MFNKIVLELKRCRQNVCNVFWRGNITYTGAGHSDLSKAPDTEVQLFVNTLIATFEVGVSDPSIGLYETPDASKKPITSLIIPYDGTVTKPDSTDNTAYDSSILRDLISFKFI